jgi:hypothetical protein
MDYRLAPALFANSTPPSEVSRISLPQAPFSKAPMTPPISPANSDRSDAGIAVDADTASRAVCVPSQNLSEHDATGLAQPIAIGLPLPPIRLFEDEKFHVQRPGTLRLTDLEVRGTLGTNPSVLSLSHVHTFVLGTGTFGRVLLVRLRSGPCQPGAQNYFALKVLRKTEIVRLRQVEHVNAERYILLRVRHPFVVDLFTTFQDSLNIYMLMSYVPGGELFTHLRRAQRFTPDVTRFYLANIILALKYLHSFNIIYRDLKPENLLLDSRGYLRLTDFGFAKIVDDRTWTLCGTPEYLAPEIIQSDGHGKAADWWACGVLCYEMLAGYPPFFDESAYAIYEKILRGHINWPRDMDRLSKDLIRAFLHPNRSKRLGNLIGGPQDILDHPWFRGVDWEALERCEIRVRPHPQFQSSCEV